MADTGFEFQAVEGGVPIKMWTRGATRAVIAALQEDIAERELSSAKAGLD